MVRLAQIGPGNAVLEAYKVLAKLPELDGEFQYRIKSEREPYQRIVKEYHLEMT